MKPSFYREVGDKIRIARAGKQITQEALGAAVGLSRTSLTNIEKGRQKLLVHTLVEIASALQVSPSDLLPNVNEMLEAIRDSIPQHMAPDELDFIARAVSSTTPNEKRTSTFNKKQSGRPS